MLIVLLLIHYQYIKIKLRYSKRRLLRNGIDLNPNYESITLAIKEVERERRQTTHCWTLDWNSDKIWISSGRRMFTLRLALSARWRESVIVRRMNKCNAIIKMDDLRRRKIGWWRGERRKLRRRIEVGESLACCGRLGDDEISFSFNHQRAWYDAVARSDLRRTKKPASRQTIYHVSVSWDHVSSSYDRS